MIDLLADLQDRHVETIPGILMFRDSLGKPKKSRSLVRFSEKYISREAQSKLVFIEITSLDGLLSQIVYFSLFYIEGEHKKACTRF